MKKSQSYYFVVKNNTTMEFNVFGPTIDDQPWTDQVVAWQKDGEDINCFTSSTDSSDFSTVVSKMENLGFKYNRDLYSNIFRL